MFIHRIAARIACAIVIAALVCPVAALAQTLSLNSALQRAIAASPRLTAAEKDIGIATGQRIQAGALLNPEVGYEQDDSFGTGRYRGTRSAETTLQISQLFELFGKREARVAVGRAAEDVAAIQRQAVRLEVLSETAIAFLTVLGAQRRIQILDEQVEAINRLTPLLQRRVDAGAASPAEIGRALVASDLVKTDRERLRGLLSSVRRELAVLMGDTNATYATVSGRLEALGKPPSFDSVVRAIDANPQLVRWTAVFAQRNAELIVARLKPYPDARLSAGVRHYNETGDTAVRLGVTVALPIFDQNAGGIIAAEQSLDKTRFERAANRATLIVFAGRAYDAVQASLRELAIMRDSTIPKAREASSAIFDGYGQGRFTLLEVLDAQASFAQARLREQEAQQNFHIAVATIEGLVGNPFALARESSR